LSVESLTDWDAPIKAHFSSPELQYIGSTSSCGCAIPHAMFHNFGWPEMEFQEEARAMQSVLLPINPIRKRSSICCEPLGTE